jgi:two-component system sensor histidine kinase HydH
VVFFALIFGYIGVRQWSHLLTKEKVYDMRKGLTDDIYSRELSAVIKLSSLIHSSLQTTDVLTYAMKATEEFMDAEASSVYEFDAEKEDMLVSFAGKGKGTSIESKRVQLGEGIPGRVIRTGKPVMVEDVHKEPMFDDWFDRETGFTTKSLICVPLIIRDKTTGAIQVINKKNGKPFNREDSELLTALAQQVAVALDNAKLYQRLEEHYQLTAEELKITKQKFIRSERSAALANLVQGVAHEVRNPIMSIGGFAKRMKADLEKDNKFQKYLNIILNETNRLEKLVQDVKEIAEMQIAHLQLENMNRILSGVIKDFVPIMDRQSVHVETDIEEPLPLMSLDKRQIARALKNIIQNSIEALPANGALKITAQAVDSMVRIIVEDFGIGIQEDKLGSVLDPFVTSKTTGAGLGLTMVYQIVMNHHGKIDIKSKGGKGTVVTLDLPRDPVR